MTAPQIPGFPFADMPGFPSAAAPPAAPPPPAPPAPPPAAPHTAMPGGFSGFPGFPATSQPAAANPFAPPQAQPQPMAASSVAPPFAGFPAAGFAGGAPAAPVAPRGRYAGQALPGARYPIPAAGYTYDLRVTKTALVGERGAAQTFVIECETVASNNPGEAPGTKHGYPISLMYDSGYGSVLAFVLAACGCTSEAELVAKGGNPEAICTACESQPETLAGRTVRAMSYDKPRGKKSAKPGQVDTHLQFAPAV